MTADIIGKIHGEDVPAGIVRNAGRPGESYTITSVGQLKEADIDMFSLVIIGNSSTYVQDGRMITPRGYKLEQS